MSQLHKKSLRITGKNMCKIKILVTCFLLIISQVSYAVESTYNIVIAGKKCQETHDQDLACSYRVGKSLHIEITGIGSPDTGITFLKSDFYGDYYGKYGMKHGCIIINSTVSLFNLAFISPKNGKVYPTWQECANGI